MKAKNMTFQQIRDVLNQRDIQWTDIAAALNVTHSHVIGVAKRTSQSLKTAKAICLALDKPLADVFSDMDCYISPKKRGRKDRTPRRQEVIAAIASGNPVPATKH